MRLYQPIPRVVYVTLALTSFAAFFATWVLLSQTIAEGSIFLPSPAAVLRDAIVLFREHAFLVDVRDSVCRVSLGFLAAVIVALPLGVLAGTYAPVDAIVQPLNDFIRYMPVAAFIPITILWIGVGDPQKIAIIFLGTVFQLIPLIADTVARVPTNLVELGYTMGLSQVGVLIRVVIPWSLPTIYDHCRVALGWAWSYLVVAELVAALSGIGHVIIQAQRFIQTGNVITGILVIGVIGLVFDLMFKIPKRRLFPWI